MQLKHRKLQKIVENVMNEEKKSEAFKHEIRNAVGPKVLITHGLKLMAESANNQLDILEKTGKSPGDVKASLLLQFSDSEIHEVRRLVARLLPENLVKKMMYDRNSFVRVAVARRLPASLVKEIHNRFPSDDQVFSIYREKKLQEASAPKLKPSEKELDIYGEFPLGDAYDDIEHPGFTDEWYNTLAHKIINGPTAYGNNLECNWEEKIAKNICSAYQSQGVEVDYDKLLKSLKDHLSIRDEARSDSENKKTSSTVDESILKSISKQLRFEEDYNPVMMPVIQETFDPVEDLLCVRGSSSYISKFEEVFEVTMLPVENPGKNVGINESFSRVIVPVSARLPTSMLRSQDEKALDMYVQQWNRQRDLRNQQYKLTWAPSKNDTVRFHLRVK